MRVRNLHGYFIFDETRTGQISEFLSLYEGFQISRVGNLFTFTDLEDAPRYSIKNGQLLGVTATANFEGEPWEVFEANGLVYNFSTGLMVPISSISQTINLNVAGNKYISNGLILPGSLTDDGERVKDYSAWLSRGKWYYSEVTFV